MPVTVKCAFCKKEKMVKPSKLKINKQFFCNYSCKTNFQKGKPTWNKGMKLTPHTLEHIAKIRDSCKKNLKLRFTQFKKGHNWTDKAKQKRIDTLKRNGTLSGKNNPMFGRNGALNPNWQGGISYWRKKYYNSIPYKKWRNAVFKKDGYTCQMCGNVHTNKENTIHAHHIKSFARYPNFRLDVNNGLTLCKSCHMLVHSKKASIGKIISVEQITEKENMVDITIADNNNFFANGVLVHNSGTPYREDGRTNYIMALTGYPIGLDWRTIMQVLGKEYHTVNVHVVKDLHSKFELVKQLYNPERRTIIFVNLLDIGEKLADMLNVPFISGSSKKRMDIIKESKSFVASRVLELGVSIKDLEHIIEVDFLFGSRREEVQRTGRLMHSLAKGKVHDIVMTKEELENYGKRLYGLYEKGFRYKLIPHLSGVTISSENKVKVKPSKKGGISYTKVIDELFKEGFFQSERTFGEISKSLERRGVTTSSIKPHIFSKLNGMVKTGKLFKIESSDGYKFKQRN